MAEFKSAPTIQEVQGKGVPPAPVAEKDKGEGPKLAEQIEKDTKNPEEVLKQLSSLEFSMASAKFRIAGSGEEEQEVVEQESRMTARARMTEDKQQWAGKDEGEASSRMDRLKQSFKRSVPRWWKYGVNSLGTYVKEKDQSHRLLAEAGVQMQALPYEFLRTVRNAAQEQITEQRQGEPRRRFQRVRNIRNRLGRDQRELANREAEIVRNLRGVFDPNRSDDADVQAFASSNTELVNLYREVRSGDFKASEGLARRLGSEFGDDAIRTAVGEKKATIDLTSKEAKPIADFFKNDVITPMLVEGLANGGTISEDRLLELRTTVQEKFFTKEFAVWHKSLPKEVQKQFDLSMSYGTDIIPVFQHIMLPQLMAIKDHLQSGSNLREYVEGLDLKVNIGTLQAGEQGSVGESNRERKYSRHVTNQRVRTLYREIEASRGPEPIVPGAYTDALDAASARLRTFGFSNMRGHNTAAIAAGVGLYAWQLLAKRAAGLAVPFLGSAAVGGVGSGVQEKDRFTRDLEQYDRENSRGVGHDPEARIRNEMDKLMNPKIDIRAVAIDPLREVLQKLESGTVDDASIKRALGLLADAQARRHIMDADRKIELYRTFTDQPLDQEKSELQFLRAQTTAGLRTYFADNPDRLQSVAQSFGYQPAQHSLDAMVTDLGALRRRNLEGGGGNVLSRLRIQDQRRLPNDAALGLTDISRSESIDARQRAMVSARRWAQFQKGATTAAAILGGGAFSSLITEEVFAMGHRVGEWARNVKVWSGTRLGDVMPTFDRPTQTTNLERLTRLDKIMPEIEKAQVPTYVSEISGHNIKIPDGTQWVPDGAKYDLVMKSDPNQILINDAFYGANGLEYDETTSLIRKEQIAMVGDRVTEERKVFGEDGVWKEYATPTDHREYYDYDTKDANRNELKLHTLKKDGKLILLMENPEVSASKHLNPTELDIQKEIEEGRAPQIAETVHGDLDNPIVMNANHVYEYKGKWQAGLALDPNDTDPAHMVDLGNNRKVTQADLFRLLAEKELFDDLPEGDFSSELHPERRNVFKLGGPDGGRGQISVGRLVDRNGGKVWQSYSTIFGTGKTPDMVEFPTDTQIPEVRIDVPKGKPWQPFGIPIPFPWSRRPLEAGKSTKGEPLPPRRIKSTEEPQPEPPAEPEEPILPPAPPEQVEEKQEEEVKEQPIQVEPGNIDQVLKGLALREEHYDKDDNGKQTVKEDVIQEIQAYLQDAAVRGIPPEEAEKRFRAFYNAERFRKAREDGKLTKEPQYNTENRLTDAEKATVRWVAADTLRSMYSVNDAEAQEAIDAILAYADHIDEKTPESAWIRGDHAERTIRDMVHMYFDIKNIREIAQPATDAQQEGSYTFTKDIRRKLRDSANGEQVVTADATELTDFFGKNPQALFGPDIEVSDLAIDMVEDENRNHVIVSGTFTLPGQQPVSLTNASFSVNDNGQLIFEGNPEFDTSGLRAEDISTSTGLLASRFASFDSSMKTSMTSLGREGWEVIGFELSEDGQIGVKYRKLASTAPAVEGLVGDNGPAGPEGDGGEALEAEQRMRFSDSFGVTAEQGQHTGHGMSAEYSVIPEYRKNPQESFVGIYDGHGTNSASTRAKSLFSRNLDIDLNSGMSPEDALRQSFWFVNEAMHSGNIKGGAFTLVGYRTNHELYIANAGDGQAVVIHGGIPQPLAERHTMENKNESDRVKLHDIELLPRANGSNIGTNGPRVATRGIGFHDENVVSMTAEPFIHHYTLEPNDSRIIYANGGLWSRMSMAEVHNLIRDISDPDEAAQVVKSAYVRKAGADVREDVVVVVQDLQQFESEQQIDEGGEGNEKSELLAKIMKDYGQDVRADQLDSEALQRAVEKFKENPTLFLQHGREYVRRIMKNESLPLDVRKERVSKALDALVDLQIEFDHMTYPRGEHVYKGVPEYIPDGLTDMGSNVEPDVAKRGGREKIRIDKTELYGQFKPLLTEIFTDETIANRPLTEWKKAVSKRIASYVYEEMPYNAAFTEHPDQRMQTVTLGSMLEQKLAVCRHHALASQVIFQTLGITSRLMKSDVIFGDGTGGEHANNVIRLDGKWYLYDSTAPYQVTTEGNVFKPYIRELPGVNDFAEIDLNKQPPYEWSFPTPGDEKHNRTYKSRNNMFYQIKENNGTS